MDLNLHVQWHVQTPSIAYCSYANFVVSITLWAQKKQARVFPLQLWGSASGEKGGEGEHSGLLSPSPWAR